MKRSRVSPEDFTVGWVCALPIELAAAEKVLDERYDVEWPETCYTLGRIGSHDVVLVCLPAGCIGTNRAASAATKMLADFPSIRSGLMVGIGGGVPGTSGEADVRLGDVVISQPEKGYGGVVQYDFGKSGADGRLKRTGFLNAPSKELLDAVTKLRSKSYEGHAFATHLAAFDELPGFSLARAGADVLFQPDSEHAEGLNCESCNLTAQICRPIRESNLPLIHYGTIASGNQVVKDGLTRDRYSTDLGGVLCFEMEAAGTMNAFPCLVIRGICDYADQHKNKSWQPYAAAVAAACAKETLLLLPGRQSTSQPCSDEMLRKARELLPAPNPRTDLEKALGQRNADTGLWFLNGDKFENWKTTPGSRIWLYGIPGCGKTILSATVIENVQEWVHEDPSRRLAFHHFVFNDAQKQSTDLMLRSVVIQLLEQGARLPSTLESVIIAKRTPTAGELLDMLREMMEESINLCIILDALDECEYEEELLDVLKKIASWNLDSLHLLLTSRPEPAIQDALEQIVDDGHRVCLQSELVNADIQKYVRQRLSQDRKLRKWQQDSTVQHQIERKLADGAQGMFRWAACQLDSLSTCRNRLELQRALETMPTTLDATYDRIISNISERDTTYAVRILRWLVFSERPLLLEEVAEIVAFDTDRDPMFDPLEVLMDPSEALEICSSLVVAGPKDYGFNRRWRIPWQTDGRVLSLAHFSVKEYLTSSRGCQMKCRLFELNSRLCHGFIASCCLDYLYHFGPPGPSVNDELSQLKLGNYAAFGWHRHADRVDVGNELLQDKIMAFLSTANEAYLTWSGIYNVIWDEPMSRYLEREALTPPYVLCALGRLDSVLRCLLKNHTGLDAHESIHGTMLQAAVNMGHLKTVKTLIQKRVDVNAPGGAYGTALQGAANNFELEIAQILLEAGAEIDAAHKERGTALQIAADRGDIPMIRMLLNAGADVDAQGGRGSTALQIAANRGHIETVRMLLVAGANVNRQDGICGTALRAAAHNGSIYMVRMLLEAGADVNRQDGRYGTALQAAARKGYIHMVLTLLEAGADVNARGGRYCTALQAAARKGDRHIVRMLLDADADVNIEGECFGNALRAAVTGQKGDSEVVRMLLQAGAITE